MPIFHPPKPFITREPLDVDALNENFQEIHSTISTLNEHNWSIGALETMEAQWAPDIALRMHFNRVSIDPYGGSTVDIDGSGQWKALSGGTKTFTTRGGKHLIIASFQIETVTNISATREPGLMFGFDVDGAFISSSLLGSGDLSNDLVQQASVPGSPVKGPLIDLATAPALRGGYIPVVIERLVTLGEGEHTVSVVSRNVQATTAVAQDVSQMLLVVLEMWA